MWRSEASLQISRVSTARESVPRWSPETTVPWPKYFLMKLLQSGAQNRAVLDTVISKLMAQIGSKPAQLDCASLLKLCSVPDQANASQN